MRIHRGYREVSAGADFRAHVADRRQHHGSEAQHQAKKRIVLESQRADFRPEQAGDTRDANDRGQHQAAFKRDLEKKPVEQGIDNNNQAEVTATSPEVT